MSLKRKAIRKAIGDILKVQNAGVYVTDAQDRVFTSQTTPSWVEDLPLILIYTRSEDVEIFNEAPREWKRMVNFVIEVIAKGPEEPNLIDVNATTEFLDDTLDKITSQVECELSRDDTLNATADDINLSSVEFAFEGDGQFPIGSARLIYQVTYYTSVPDSIDKQAGVTDLTGADIDWHVGHDNEAPDLTNTEAQDSVDIPTK